MAANTLLIVKPDHTEEFLLEPVARAKKTLSEYALSYLENDLVIGDRLVDLAQAVRTQEELAGVQIRYLRLLKNPNTKSSDLYAYLLTQASRRYDTYSGRRNDSIRSAQDSICEWIQSQMTGIKEN